MTLYRILYCSRSELADSPAAGAEEIRQILAKSRANNARDDITGGLFFSNQCFAQVLEGPAEKVEETFERIQCDMRHRDVTVLEAGPIATRDFPAWSMAFTGSTDASAFGQAVLSAAFSGQTQAGDKLLDILRSVVVREDEWLANEAA
ncbi:BLUF domain-containing protein [Beijerinckia sp. L45]|uniref:BLUF domain-containing protein n=1 Tax=Beijerinckia sp. L45 TaxID=1641855 RepID=UPI00131B78E3|nr:BLUF domain-containing protein [Beijerinckia sp. L45]